MSGEWVEKPRSNASDESTLKRHVEVVGEPWLDSPYYADAERWTFLFWRPEGHFRQLFDRLDLTSVVELACGHGRHAEQIVNQVGRLVLMDIFEANLDRCRARLQGRTNVEFISGDGYTFKPLADSSTTAIFCYDAMVHFSSDLVASYLKEAQRILVPGGLALLHHSNYGCPHEGHYGQNPHARNYMTQALFGCLAQDARLEVVESRVIPWGEESELDCLSLCRK